MSAARGEQPNVTADALAQAAVQATCRAVYTANLAVAAYERTGRADSQRAETIRRLRDGVLDAYAQITDAERQALREFDAKLTSDELMDLLALLVRG